MRSAMPSAMVDRSLSRCSRCPTTSRRPARLPPPPSRPPTSGPTPGNRPSTERPASRLSRVGETLTDTIQVCGDSPGSPLPPGVRPKVPWNDTDSSFPPPPGVRTPRFRESGVMTDFRRRPPDPLPPEPSVPLEPKEGNPTGDMPSMDVDATDTCEWCEWWCDEELEECVPSGDCASLCMPSAMEFDDATPDEGNARDAECSAAGDAPAFLPCPDGVVELDPVPCRPDRVPGWFGVRDVWFICSMFHNHDRPIRRQRIEWVGKIS